MRRSLALAVLVTLSIPATANARACSEKETRGTVDRFLGAMRAGDAGRANALFAGEPRFEWYSDPGRMTPASQDRSTLRAYFASLIADGRAPTHRRRTLQTHPDP